jgi:hypothetical protein
MSAFLFRNVRLETGKMSQIMRIICGKTPIYVFFFLVFRRQYLASLHENFLYTQNIVHAAPRNLIKNSSFRFSHIF